MYVYLCLISIELFCIRVSMTYWLGFSVIQLPHDTSPLLCGLVWLLKLDLPPENWKMLIVVQLFATQIGRRKNRCNQVKLKFKFNYFIFFRRPICVAKSRPTINIFHQVQVDPTLDSQTKPQRRGEVSRDPGRIVNWN